MRQTLKGLAEALSRWTAEAHAPSFSKTAVSTPGPCRARPEFHTLRLSTNGGEKTFQAAARAPDHCGVPHFSPFPTALRTFSGGPLDLRDLLS